MTKDIYVAMKQCRAPTEIEPEETRKSSSKQDRGEFEKRHKGGLCRNKVDPLVQPAEPPVQPT